MRLETACKASRTTCGALCLAACFSVVQSSQAAEYGFGTYLLGLNIPMMGFTPPPGFYLSDSVYAYQGSASGNVKFPLGASLDAGVKASFLVNISTLSWITDIKILGGNLGFAATIPFPIGTERTSVNASFTGPLGRTLSGSLTQSVWGIGDTAVAGLVGWHEGNSHWNLVVTGTIPTGVYDSNMVAFLGLHRPSLDVKGAYTWLNPQIGTEISGALGVTFNYINTETNYQTGTELHFEWGVNQHFASGFSVGVGGYVYDQLTGDSGSGNRVGPFEGRVIAVGPLIGYTFKVMQVIPVNLTARWFHEFDVQNRLAGNSVFGTISIPLVNLPPTLAAKY